MSTFYRRHTNGTTFYGNGRSNYNGCGCNDEPILVEEKKESSATAKTALGLAIGGLGLAAVNGGLFGGNGECGGGLLGGLFGGNRGNCEQLARGRQAETELSIIHSYMMPTWTELCDLKKQVAVNRAIEDKNNEITHLLFKRSEEQANCGFELNRMRTEAAFALAEQKSQCCCDKLNDKIDYASALERQRTEAAFALANQKQECCCDRLDTRITCEADKAAASLACNVNTLDTKIDSLYGGLSAKTDYKFTISNLETDAKFNFRFRKIKKIINKIILIY